MSDILEVFGAAPLVHPPSGAEPVGAEQEKPDGIQNEANANGEVEEGASKRAGAPSVSGLKFDDPYPYEVPVQNEDEDARQDAGSDEHPSALAGDVDVDSRGPDGRPMESVLADVYEALSHGQSQLGELMTISGENLSQLADDVRTLAKQASILPGKLRGLGERIDDLTTSLADRRFRDLLIDVTSLGDLVQAALTAVPAGNKEVAAARRFLEVFDTRIRDTLQANGVEEIEAHGAFDPTIHHATEIVPVYQPEQDGQVTGVLRRGYRTPRAILRYAEVAVGRLWERRRSEAEPNADSQAEPEGEADWNGLTPVTLSPVARRRRPGSKEPEPDEPSDPSPKGDDGNADA